MAVALSNFAHVYSEVMMLKIATLLLFVHDVIMPSMIVQYPTHVPRRTQHAPRSNSCTTPERPVIVRRKCGFLLVPYRELNPDTQHLRRIVIGSLPRLTAQCIWVAPVSRQICFPVMKNVAHHSSPKSQTKLPNPQY